MYVTEELWYVTDESSRWSIILRTRHRGSVHVDTLKLDLGQTSKEHIVRSRPTERRKYSKTWSTHFLLQILVSVGRYDPFRLIMMIFVIKKGVYNVPGISDRFLGYYLETALTLTWKKHLSLPQHISLWCTSSQARCVQRKFSSLESVIRHVSRHLCLKLFLSFFFQRRLALFPPFSRKKLR